MVAYTAEVAWQLEGRRFAIVSRSLPNARTADVDNHAHLPSCIMSGAFVDNFIEAQKDSAGGTFVYISGPEGFAAGAEQACVRQKRRLRQQNGTKEIAWHNATFTV